jgi:Tfp pilus assembly protein PilP
MKKIVLLVLILSLGTALTLFGQEKKTEAQTAEQVVSPPAQLPPQQGLFTYNPEGRRDPFKDLLGGRDIREKTATGEIGQIPVENLVLIGIIKSKKGFTAIVGTTQGFPYFVSLGDKFSDGYVLSITETQVVFRKTHERGIPLMRPRDIIKEINPEER